MVPLSPPCCCFLTTCCCSSLADELLLLLPPRMCPTRRPRTIVPPTQHEAATATVVPLASAAWSFSLAVTDSRDGNFIVTISVPRMRGLAEEENAMRWPQKLMKDRHFEQRFAICNTPSSSCGHRRLCWYLGSVQQPIVY